MYNDVAVDEKKRCNHDNVLSGCVSIRVLVEIRKEKEIRKKKKNKKGKNKKDKKLMEKQVR